MEGVAEEESSVLSEVKKQLRLAGPLAVGCLLQKIILTISLMFVGHPGEIALASASLATSFAGATGFYLMPGHAVRAGLRRGSAPPGRRLQAARHAGARSGERPGGRGLGLHGRDPRVVQARPGDRRGGRQLHPADDPGASSVRAAAVPRPVPAGAEPRCAGRAQLRRRRRRARRRLLAARAQAWPGRRRRRPGHRRLLLFLPVLAGALRQARAVLQGHLDGVLPRGIPRHPRILQARRAVRSHDLLGVLGLRDPGAALRSSP